MKWNQVHKYVINLERRKDRLESITAKLEEQNIEAIIWPAIDGLEIKVPIYSRKIKEYNAAGILACMKSHYSLIKNAKSRGVKYIAVFEDDAIFSNDFNERIKYCEGMDFDILYLGGQFNKMGRDVSATEKKYIFKAKNVGGTYAYVMRNTVFDYVIDEMNFNWGADEFFAERLQKIFDCKAFIPFMCGHEDGGYSDVARHKTKCPNVNKDFQKRRIL
ncbi:glycosyltransferase family 25 protein [Candidatus Bathyarchaeota archaeon]|nr:glycosyltransferase family 25 protein [Candidatus Bathyarchaeota archaeon]